jgi:hypothetical protein
MKERLKKAATLAEEHWSYLRGVLEMDDIPHKEITRIGYHYKTAFVHGFKHCLEDKVRYETEIDNIINGG